MLWPGWTHKHEEVTVYKLDDYKALVRLGAVKK